MRNPYRVKSDDYDPSKRLYDGFNRPLPHGTFVKMFKNRPTNVQILFQNWLNEMTRDYGDGFQILNQSQSEFPAGVCMYVTYKC